MLSWLFIAALWSLAGKVLSSWLSCVWCFTVLVTFPCGVLGQVWYLIVYFSGLCLLTYFYCYSIRLYVNKGLKIASLYCRIVLLKTQYLALHVNAGTQALIAQQKCSTHLLDWSNPWRQKVKLCDTFYCIVLCSDTTLPVSLPFQVILFRPCDP